MVFVSFNVNGIRAAIQNGLENFIETSKADFILIQETKVNSPVDLSLVNSDVNPKSELQYKSLWNFAEKKGYSGTAVLFKEHPLNVNYGFLKKNNIDGITENEGRIITLEYPSFFLVNAYFPNSQRGLKRWYYRLDWFDAFYEHVSHLCHLKPVIIGGDFNLAHDYLDIYWQNESDLKSQAGFTDEERDEFDNLLEMDFVDTFRLMHPEERTYTWWSKNHENYKHNRGRRIDYFLVSKKLKTKIRESSIFSEIKISDHVPIRLELEL